MDVSMVLSHNPTVQGPCLMKVSTYYVVDESDQDQRIRRIYKLTFRVVHKHHKCIDHIPYPFLMRNAHYVLSGSV